MAFVQLLKLLSLSYGSGSDKSDMKVREGILHRKCRSWGHTLYLLRFLSEVKGTVPQVRSEPSGGEWWTQKLAKFKMLTTVRVICTRAFSS